jgi:hypothetical protein
MAEPEDRANAISTPEIEEVRIFPGLEFAMGAVFLAGHPQARCRKTPFLCVI